jgi:hypothetical protein
MEHVTKRVLQTRVHGAAMPAVLVPASRRSQLDPFIKRAKAVSARHSPQPIRDGFLAAKVAHAGRSSPVSRD